MKLFKLLFVLILCFSCPSCIHVESPHNGVVEDAETGKPVKGVVVHIDLETAFLLAAADGNTQWKDGYETLTNKAGVYKLPRKVIRQGPLEITAGKELSFIKAGYLPSRILEPSKHNSINLHPIEYYLDYAYFKKKSEEGGWGTPHYYMDEKPEAFTEYRKEISKMKSLQVVQQGDKGIFLEIPETILTKLNCKIDFVPLTSHSYSKPYTFGISGNVCTVFDEVSRKMMTFDAQGNTKEMKDNLFAKYNLVSAASNEGKAVYANSDSIYIPNPPYSNMAKKVAPQKGNIIALAGDSNEYLTLEDNGLYLCYFSIWHDIGKGCISIVDVFSGNDRNNERLSRFISIEHGYSPARDHDYFVISIKDFEYRIHKITYKSDSSGKMIFNLSELLSPKFPVDDEIIDFASNGQVFFIAFKRGGIKKYSLDRYRKGPLKEDKAFYDNSHNLFSGKSISAVNIGRSVHERVLYVIVGDSTIYRLSLDGVPDYRIKIVEK